MPEDQTNTPLIVVGSSAGGIEALSRLAATLPEDLDVPVVIARHLDPERESRLPEILGRRTSLPVRTVADHDHLEPGVVYVIEAILSGMSDAVLAVDAEERVLFSNEIFSELFGAGEPGDPDGSQKLGRSVPLTEGGGEMPAQETPQRRAVRGEPFEMRFATTGEDGALRHFEARGMPIDGEDVGGGVIVIREAPRHPRDGSR